MTGMARSSPAPDRGRERSRPAHSQPAAVPGLGDRHGCQGGTLPGHRPLPPPDGPAGGSFGPIWPGRRKKRRTESAGSDVPPSVRSGSDAQMLASLLAVGHGFTTEPFWNVAGNSLIAGLIAHIGTYPLKERHLRAVAPMAVPRRPGNGHRRHARQEPDSKPHGAGPTRRLPDRAARPYAALHPRDRLQLHRRLVLRTGRALLTSLVIQVARLVRGAADHRLHRGSCGKTRQPQIAVAAVDGHATDNSHAAHDHAAPANAIPVG